MLHDNTQVPYILDDGATARALVFGLKWSPLVGSRIASLARKRARQARATHYVYGGNRGAAVGCASLGKMPRAQTNYSAAQIFARQYPDGAVAVLLKLDEDTFRLAGALDGAVIARTDKLFNTNLAAHQALGELRQASPALVIYGEHGSAMPEDFAATAPVRALSIEQITQGADAQSCLIPAGRAWASLSFAVRALLVLLSCSLVLQIVYFSRRHSRLKAVVPATAVAPSIAWQQAIDGFARLHPVHTGNESRRVMETFRRLPLDIDGWSLTGAMCQAGGSLWTCGARYARRGRVATNSALLGAVPAG